MTEIVKNQVTTVTGEKKVDEPQRTAYIIYFIFGVLEVLLIARFLFKLTGANPTSGFVNFIYSITQIFTVPFTGIFPQTSTTGVVTAAVLEPSTVVAIIVYAIIAWGIIKLIAILTGRVQE